MDFRRQSREHTAITIYKTPVEWVNSFKFLCVHITEDLTCSAHTDAVLKKAHQRLFFLRQMRKFGMSPGILRSFYTCTVENILTGCITALVWNSTAGNHKALQRVLWTARHIVRTSTPGGVLEKPGGSSDQPSVSHGSGPAVAKAWRRMSLWCSQTDLADDLERGLSFLRSLATNEGELLDYDDAISLTSSDPAASALLGSAQEEQEMSEGE